MAIYYKLIIKIIKKWVIGANNFIFFINQFDFGKTFLKIYKMLDNDDGFFNNN